MSPITDITMNAVGVNLYNFNKFTSNYLIFNTIKYFYKIKN